VVDVRAPKEYLQGHIPQAVSMPLFTDEERAIIGTLYKQVGRDTAVEKGLELVGPKLASFVTQAKLIAPDKRIIVLLMK
jgi:tRNA 2-selenouridine synthase